MCFFLYFVAYMFMYCLCSCIPARCVQGVCVCLHACLFVYLHLHRKNGLKTARFFSCGVFWVEHLNKNEHSYRVLCCSCVRVFYLDVQERFRLPRFTVRVSRVARWRAALRCPTRISRRRPLRGWDPGARLVAGQRGTRLNQCGKQQRIYTFRICYGWLLHISLDCHWLHRFLCKKDKKKEKKREKNTFTLQGA